MPIYDVTESGRKLHGRFLLLGEMTGKTSADIIAVAGNPSSISRMNGGQKLLQWQATGCHMAMIFDANDMFVTISHQYAQYVPAEVVAEYKAKQAFSTVTAIVICIVIVVVAMLIAHQ